MEIQDMCKKREAAPIDPYFMPGFQGEATYFNNLNPSATEITSGEAPVLDTSGKQGHPLFLGLEDLILHKLLVIKIFMEIKHKI